MFHPAREQRGLQDASAAFGTGSHLQNRKAVLGKARLQIPGALAYCLFQRWLNYPDTGLPGTLTWLPPCVGPHTSTLFWGCLASKNQEGSCLPSSPLGNTQDRVQQVEFQVLSLDHIAAPSRKLPSAAADNSQSSRPLPYRPCTTPWAHQGPWAFFPLRVWDPRVWAAKVLGTAQGYGAVAGWEARMPPTFSACPLCSQDLGGT